MFLKVLKFMSNSVTPALRPQPPLAHATDRQGSHLNMQVMVKIPRMQQLVSGLGAGGWLRCSLENAVTLQRGKENHPHTVSQGLCKPLYII